MSNNDIALSFDTAEYYNLQEACDYLNRKFETDNISPKKLLKRIYEFDLDAYIYGRGFYLMGSHYLDEDKLDFLDDLDKDGEDYQIYTTQIDAYLFFCDVKPSLTCKELGVFIQLSHRMISNLLLLERTEISDEWADIEGLLPHNRLNANPKDVEEFLLPSDRPSTYKGQDYNFDKIKVVESRYQPILPKRASKSTDLKKHYQELIWGLDHYHLEDYQIEHYEGVNSLFNNKETYALNLEATPDDILILHKDLELLIELIIENKPAIEKTEIVFKKKGVSPKLLKAKLVADTHAQYLWSKDHDKKIRIGEMCELIWSYLIDTGHGEMLPERTATLKSWLSSIPQYASEAGRPQS
ncbi:hypothetical protein [Psychrobacter sp. WY6]|uniref:hypothetical protein n=1 Tax=Psychrobacter sp. WY6 TaxID=2708350 RepID=UPI002022CF51|nr:hypothetical protein [Psychrobacter sp. WY6]